MTDFFELREESSISTTEILRSTFITVIITLTKEVI